MTRIVAPARAGRRPVKRIDLRDIREVLKDSRVWAAVGQVIQPDGEATATHYELVPGETGAIVDILVEVLLTPSNIEVTCRLAGAAGARGAITIPDVGDEVLIVVPDGQVDWMPVLIARLSTGDVPNPVGQGPSTSTTVIMDTNVLIHDGTGGAEPVVKRSEFLSHGHPTAGTGAVSPPVVAPGPPTSPSVFPGTEVLLAK